MSIAGYDQSSAARPFFSAPETQLNAWGENPSEMLPYYGGGYLILEYFAQRMGGYDQIKPLIDTPGIGVQTFDSYLSQHAGMRFADLFRDFVVANVVNDRSVGDGRFGYQRLTQRASIQEKGRSTFPTTSAQSVRPYATRYVEYLPGGHAGTLDLSFRGAGTARLYGAPPHSGQAQWWGNAADEMASTLTRTVDLTGVGQATLRFSAWFDVEPDYDYAGVSVSTDAGCSWQTLPGTHTTTVDPVGQNFGNGFTGRSGDGSGDDAAGGWVDVTMDLTPFAGREVLLRFYYVTDQSYHGSGVAFDDISIPEIGFADDAETDAGWEARGFLRSVNAASLDWAVQAITFGDQGTQVLQLPVAPDSTGGALAGTLSIPSFGSGVRRVVVAVSPLVPVTLEPADYTLEARLR
jgi:hypothetical protein